MFQLGHNNLNQLLDNNNAIVTFPCIIYLRLSYKAGRYFLKNIVLEPISLPMRFWARCFWCVHVYQHFSIFFKKCMLENWEKPHVCGNYQIEFKFSWPGCFSLLSTLGLDGALSCAKEKGLQIWWVAQLCPFCVWMISSFWWLSR